MTEKCFWLFVASFLMAVAAFTVYEDKYDEDVFDKNPFEVDNFDEQGTRQGKILFPFVSIVRFANVDCSSTNTMNGTCLARRECNNLNGTITGVCASRRGRCCIGHVTISNGMFSFLEITKAGYISSSGVRVGRGRAIAQDAGSLKTGTVHIQAQTDNISRTCGTTTNVNNTYFTSPGYPAAYPGGQACTIIVNRCNNNICQLRIDLLDMVLAQPDGDGVCTTDALTITGGNTIVPTLCGDNTGQTLFVDFNGNAAITISVTATLATTFARRWNIRLTQLGCDCPGLAPNGCLQYYTGITGTINSFNYGTGANTALSASLVTGTRQLANLNYGICIRMEAGYCAIQYAQAANDIFSFTVTGDVEGADNTVLGTAVGAVTGAACTTDFVVIPNPVTPGTLVSVGTDRFCGIGFATVQTGAKPFVLFVVTDANEGATATTPPDVANRGFSLTYTQVAC